MTVTIPLQKQDTTNLYRHGVTINRSLLILPEGGKVALHSLRATLEAYGPSIPDLTTFQELAESSIAHLPLITTANHIDTSMFNEVFNVDSVAVESLIGDVASLIKTEVLSRMPQVLVNEFIITIEPLV